MDICHQQFRPADEFAVLLPFDGTYGDLAAFLDTQAVGLSRVHLGVGCAVAHQRALADLRVDATWDEEGNVDVVVFKLQRLVETEQGVLGGAIGRAKRKTEQAR